MTSCVVGCFRVIRCGGRPRSALRIWRARLRWRRENSVTMHGHAFRASVSGVCPCWETTASAYTKKVRRVCWKAAMGQSAPWKAAWRWARTWAAGRWAGSAGNSVSNSGGGHRPDSAVRILLWAWWKRWRMRYMCRSHSWQLAARRAATMLPATARWRKRQRVLVVRPRRRILFANQTLKVRPQPGRAWRLLQKIRRARLIFRRGLLSSNPYKKPCRIRVPTTLQWGQAVTLSRSTSASHSWSPRQNQRCSPTPGPSPHQNHRSYPRGEERGRGGVQ
jgi:hypothetical protein